jgi:hypothetical protein
LQQYHKTAQQKHCQNNNSNPRSKGNMQPNSESTENDEEKEKIYLKVIQNIKNTLDSTAKLEQDAQEAGSNLRSKLGDKLSKESELTDSLTKYKNDVISKAMPSTRVQNCLSESVLADFEREEAKVNNHLSIYHQICFMHSAHSTPFIL